MGRLQQLNTRINPEAYKLLMLKCADQGCSTFEYVRRLVHADVGLDVNGDVPEDQEPVEKQKTLLGKMLENE